MALTRTAFPPHDMTEDERAATAGRFVMDPKAVPDPPGHGEGDELPDGVYSSPPSGREEPAPPGEVYVRAETFESEAGDGGGFEEFTVAELKAELDGLGVEYDPRARKSELVELLQKAEEA